VFKNLSIQSHKGPYTVFFDDDALEKLDLNTLENTHFIIDSKVASLYEDQMKGILSSPSVLKIEALETNKALVCFPDYVEHLVSHNVRRDHTIIAIGGGIIQDITCFLAATLLRGVAWHFFPTTLLSQADSCIGSKSSINSGSTKNILGTFTPPKKVLISTKFLDTLAEREIRSGVGEILKVHAIDGPESFLDLAKDFPTIFQNREIMMRYIQRALEIKKGYIEEDEFDVGRRNIFNYGHSFGHAIEAATKFKIPHGIAVTIGMDMANYVALELGMTNPGHRNRMHSTFLANYTGYENHPIPLTPFMEALSKDKKNIGTKLTLILPDQNGTVQKVLVNNDANFRSLCKTYLSKEIGARRV
jgi:3-dehydroquinate synthase